MEYRTPEEVAANTASVLSWRKHVEGKALKSKMRAARCPSTHCERRQECASPHECSSSLHNQQGSKGMADKDTITFHGDELQTLCEWFGVVQDTCGRSYLNKKDFLLAARLYVCAGRRPTDEMLKGAGALPRSTAVGLCAGSHFNEDNF